MTLQSMHQYGGIEAVDSPHAHVCKWIGSDLISPLSTPIRHAAGPDRFWVAVPRRSKPITHGFCCLGG